MSKKPKEYNPIPPEGCTCGALWTVRGKHGKPDCPYLERPSSAEEDESYPVLAWLAHDLPEEVTELHMITFDQWKLLYARIAARDRTKAQELLARLKAKGPQDLEPDNYDDGFAEGVNDANKRWRTLLDNKAKELE